MIEPAMQDLLVLLSDPAAWLALATLVVMEVVLGIDNLIFISILTNKLPEHQRARTRRIGIGLAVILRLGLLSGVAFIVQLTTPPPLLSMPRSWVSSARSWCSTSCSRSTASSPLSA